MFSALFEQQHELNNTRKQGKYQYKAHQYDHDHDHNHDHGTIFLTPTQVASQESIIFIRDGLLFWNSRHDVLGSCQIGGSMRTILMMMMTTTMKMKDKLLLPEILSLFANESYLLFIIFREERKGGVEVTIILKANCSTHAQIKAWAHALLVARYIHTDSNSDSDILQIMADTLDHLNRRFEGYVRGLVRAGWDLEIGALETSPGRRLHC